MFQSPPAPPPISISKAPQTVQPAAKKPLLGHECYVILGRLGDLINIFPVFREKAKSSGSPVRVVSGAEFAPLFNGVSYISPDLVNLTSDKIGKGRQYAYERYRVVRSVQVWGDDQRQSSLTQHYNMEAWQLAGVLPKFHDKGLRPLFDSRNLAEENRLIDRFVTDDKPLMILSVEGGYSSPFREYARIKRPIVEAFSKDYQIVDLSTFRARSFQDLLGLMEMASVMVLADSSPLHLAAAADGPVAALLSDKGMWNRSEPRCNAIWAADYRESVAKVGNLLQIIKRLPRKLPERLRPKLIHAVEQHQESEQEGVRNAIARKSWYEWYGTKTIIASHLREPYSRDGRSVGDHRKTPFLKEVLLKALSVARPEDAIVWTNADTIVKKELTGLIWKALDVTPVTTQRRIDCSSRKPHWGRDLCAFRASWLKEHWTEIPDFLLGTPEFDNWMALYARRINGISSTARQLSQDIYPVDLLAGAITHIEHQRFWEEKSKRYVSPENIYNLNLLRHWCRIHQPKVRFDGNGQVDWSV